MEPARHSLQLAHPVEDTASRSYLDKALGSRGRILGLSGASDGNRGHTQPPASINAAPPSASPTKPTPHVKHNLHLKQTPRIALPKKRTPSSHTSRFLFSLLFQSPSRSKMLPVGHPRTPTLSEDAPRRESIPLEGPLPPVADAPRRKQSRRVERGGVTLQCQSAMVSRSHPPPTPCPDTGRSCAIARIHPWEGPLTLSRVEGSSGVWPRNANPSWLLNATPPNTRPAHPSPCYILPP